MLLIGVQRRLHVPSLILFAASPALMGAALAAPPAQPPARPPAITLVATQTVPAVMPVTPLVAPQGEAPVGEIVVQGDVGPPKNDPLESANEDSYRITQAVDDAVIEPVTYAYRDGLPEPIRDGLGNVVRNLAEPSNALNFLLQGKVGKAFETLGRLAINSTLGVGGLFDVASKRAKLPYRRNGFANTLGFYGVKPGAYLYVPLVGATTVRDFVGNSLDQALLGFAVGAPFNRTEFAASYFVVNALDRRLGNDAELTEIAASDDPYRMRRESYLARREREIAALKGEVIPADPYPANVPTPAEDAATPPPAAPMAEPEAITQPR
jgi:phospholipid-binding lipoprotein MlaA